MSLNQCLFWCLLLFRVAHQVYLEGNATGVNVTADQQADYSIFLATEVCMIYRGRLLPS